MEKPLPPDRQALANAKLKAENLKDFKNKVAENRDQLSREEYISLKEQIDAEELKVSESIQSLWQELDKRALPVLSEKWAEARALYDSNVKILQSGVMLGAVASLGAFAAMPPARALALLVAGGVLSASGQGLNMLHKKIKDEKAYEEYAAAVGYKDKLQK